MITQIYKSFDQPGGVGSSTPLISPLQLEPGAKKGLEQDRPRAKHGLFS